MPDSTEDRTAERVRRFLDAGYPDARPVEAAVEGAVYRLGGGTVAKVWEHRRGPELQRMQRFYADAADHLPFDAPQIIAVEDIAGVPMTVERELTGHPLAGKVRTDEPEVLPEAVDCLVGVLRALAAAHDVGEVRQLPVLDEERPLWQGHSSFGSALADLIDRRVGRCGERFAAHVTDFDGKRARLVAQLRALPGTTEAVVHGDVFPETVLVDDDLRPRALVDYGFLSTAGDPRFDAAVTAAIFPTDTEHAQEITGQLTARFADEFGYGIDDLLLFRAAYAMATSDAFAPGGGDEHFAWCASVLNDPAVAEALSR
ncbi:phosphotransferase family protein [Streptomyces sp. TP-A0356]|uniref:phosphotransferase family protein n=1 Tax=Streptomyces sp. TP-A0356 TaxID=1359208 RepID=UPI0006E31197|nr:aminoglycoside phosphotransferase family protein [Streptomyces sp. TP-A0356]